jgi:hypothetical protein
MSEESKTDANATSASGSTGGSTRPSDASGPTFNESPDPLSGVKKAGKDVWDSMDGKTVTMRTYVGSIVGVIVLMMLARCGGA